MVKPYHKNVTRGIILAGKELIKSHNVKKVYRGEERPLTIVDYASKRMVNYKPDVYFVLRNNMKMIFEVLDSQEQKQDLIITDIIQACLVENVDSLYFVFSGGVASEKRILDACITIYAGLIGKGVLKQDLPKTVETFFIGKEKENPEQVRRKIIKELFA